MNRRAMTVVGLIVTAVLLVSVVPALGAPPQATAVSGLECVYVVQPGVPEFTGQMIHIRGQVNQNRFFSDDPAVFPDGTNAAVLDIAINMKSGMVTWTADAVFEPDGGGGTFVGKGGGWFRMDPVTGAVLDSKGQGVFHGTGDYEGQTLKQDLFAGDITQCPAADNLFDATVWSGFVVPPEQ